MYSLSKDGLEQMRGADGRIITFRMAPGQVVDLPDGSTLSFDDWRRWTKLQVSDEPGLWLVITAVGVAVAGVMLSLYVRPRRLWLRATPTDDGLRVEAGGLDRADSSTGLDEAVATVLDEVADGERFKTAVADVAARTGVSRNDLYEAALAARKERP